MSNLKKKKILFIANDLNIGGQGKMLKFVAGVCSRHFEKVMIHVTELSENPFNSELNIDLIHYEKGLPISLRERIEYIKAIRKLVKEYKPDCVCAFNSESSSMSRLALIFTPSIFVSAERADPYTLSPKWKFITKIVYGTSDACFFQTARARDFYGKMIEKKSYVIPNPFILPKEVEPYTGTRKKTIVSAGRFVYEKGFNVLIEAFSKVIKIYPEYDLIIYGDGPLLNDYKNQVEELGIAKDVHFPGRLGNVAESIREDGIFVLSSLWEGIPNVLLEAMSVGIPTISSNCEPGGPALLTDEGRRGDLVPTGDSASLAEAIIRLINDKEKYRRFESLGPEVRRQFDPDRIMQMWVDAFNRIMN